LTGCRIDTRSSTSWYAFAIRRRDEHGAGPDARRRGEEVVCLVAASLADLEPERLDEPGEQRKLLDDRVLELATRLVAGSASWR